MSYVMSSFAKISTRNGHQRGHILNGLLPNRLAFLNRVSFAIKSRSSSEAISSGSGIKCKRLPRAGKMRRTGNGRRRVGERPSSGLWPSRVGCLVRRPLRLLGVGLTLLYELVARFRRRPQTSSLVPGVRGRAARSRSLDPLVASAIKEVYLRPERPRLIDLWRAVRAQCLPLVSFAIKSYTLHLNRSASDPLILLTAKLSSRLTR